MVDLESSGFRFVVLNFCKENQNISCVFEEYFDETDNIFKVLLRGSEAAGMNYSVVVQGKSSNFEFCGNVLEFGNAKIEDTCQCLMMHSLQLQHYAYFEVQELRYKIIVSLI